MSLNNLFQGASPSNNGATFLDTKAILKVEEGFQIGSTTEYIYLGDYVIDSIQNNGIFDRTVSLNASNKVNSLKKQNSYFSLKYTPHENFYDEFVNSNELSRYYSQRAGSWDIYTGSFTALHIVHNNPSAASYIDYSVRTDLRNFVVNTKAQFSVASTDLYITYRRQSDNTGNFYRAVVTGGNYYIQLFTNNSFVSNITSGTIGFTLAINTSYWLRVICFEYRTIFSISTDGVTYTILADAYDTTYNTAGAVGLGTANASTTETYFDYFELTEIGDTYSTEDIIKSSLALGGINDVYIEPQYKGFTNFFSSNGSSWVLGTSNNVFCQPNGLGNSWHTYILPGTSLNNFTAECEMKGVSANANVGGFLVGTSNNFYGNYHRFDGVHDNGLEKYLGTRQSLASRGIYYTIQPNKWNKFKVVKSGAYIGWYVNNSLVNYFYGISFIDMTAVSVGLMVFRGSPSGSTIEFRNFKVQKLGDVVDDIQIDSNNKTSTLLERYLPNNYAVLSNGQTHEIVETGNSRATYSLSTNEIINNSQSKDYSRGDDLTIVVGKSSKPYVRFTNSAELIGMADSSSIQIAKDENLLSTTALIETAKGIALDNNAGINSIAIQTNFKPTIQSFDRINYNDTSLGVSNNYLVYSVNKSFDASSGSFNQRIELGYGVSQL